MTLSQPRSPQALRNQSPIILSSPAPEHVGHSRAFSSWIQTRKTGEKGITLTPVIKAVPDQKAQSHYNKSNAFSARLVAKKLFRTDDVKFVESNPSKGGSRAVVGTPLETRRSEYLTAISAPRTVRSSLGKYSPRERGGLPWWKLRADHLLRP